MKEIGLFYGAESDQTAVVARKIIYAFKDIAIEAVAIEVANREDLDVYDYIIAGVATWPGGTLPDYWYDFLDELKKTNLDNKKVAIFGLGDQISYPDHFVDSIGLLADAFEETGITLVGFTSTDGYEFNKSRALDEGKFQGLAIDMDNQPGLTDERVERWVKQLKNEFFTN